MGIRQSRRSPRAAQVAATNSNSYKYPPKTDNYFSTHFIMGGERFESAKPDAYLFGENEDLNFLGSKPTPFPYPVPQPHEPTKTLRSFVNIRRDSVRFVKESDELNNSPASDSSHARYNIEFSFDTDVKCAITIYYFAKEEISNKQAIYHPRDRSMNSDTFHYKQGVNQTFSQPTHFIDPSQFSEDDWKYNPAMEIIPVVIQCVVEEAEHLGHSHMTFGVVEKALDGGFSLKALKQKQMVDGLCYLLQEIYGIENKNTQRTRQQQDDDIEDNGSECVICMCETRDTLILPCRHLCLCNSCADNLRYQANNCPICRAKFHALLQIKAMRKKTANPSAPATPMNEMCDEATVSQNGIPAGYEAVSLIEALNGPTQPHCACSVPTLPTSGTGQSLSTAVGDAAATAADTPEPQALPEKETGTESAVEVDEVTDLAMKKVENDAVQNEQREESAAEEDTVPLPVHEDSKEETECYDMAIPISDDEDNREPTESSSYATPLHQSRVILRCPDVALVESTESAAAAAAAAEASHPCSDAEMLEEGRLQINVGSSDDSRYSSSSSTRDLLQHSQEESADDTETCGIVGCSEDINVSVV